MTKAQSDTTTPGAQFKLSMNYNSYLHFYGRTDDVKSSGFFPLAELWLDSHFYFQAAPVFVSNETQSFNYAGTIATAGFQHLSDKWMVNAYVMKPFYESSAQLAQSVLKAQTGVTASYTTSLLSFTLGGDVKFTGNTDFGAMAGIDKPIRFENSKRVIVINPGFTVNAGTQRFTNSFTRRKAGLLGLPAGNETVTTRTETFNVLSYEASVPLIYVRGKWMAMLNPSYVLPQNLMTVPGKPELSEKGEPTFYVSATLRYTF
jgi:hypothetical protein